MEKKSTTCVKLKKSKLIWIRITADHYAGITCGDISNGIWHVAAIHGTTSIRRKHMRGAWDVQLTSTETSRRDSAASKQRWDSDTSSHVSDFFRSASTSCSWCWTDSVILFFSMAFISRGNEIIKPLSRGNKWLMFIGGQECPCL